MAIPSPPPNPGSDEAIRLGCTCPVIDNHYGRGIRTLLGNHMFWISGDCPLHGNPPRGDTMPDT